MNTITITTPTGKQIRIDGKARSADVIGTEVKGKCNLLAEKISMKIPEEWKAQAVERILRVGNTCVGLTLAEAQKLMTYRNSVAAAEEAEYLASFPGLRELEAVIEDTKRYHDEFKAMMEEENNDGVNPPVPVKANYDDLAKQYPRAAILLRSRGYEQASNIHKSLAGTQAREILESGGSPEDADAILNNWLPDHSQWD